MFAPLPCTSDADRVAGAMREVLAVPALLDDAARRVVHLETAQRLRPRRSPSCTRFDRRIARAGHHLEHVPHLVRRILARGSAST